MTDTPADDDFLRRLAAALDDDLDDVPHHLLAFAQRAGQWMVVDDVLATMDTAPVGAMRALDDEQRSTTFAAPPYTITVSLRAGTLVGELSPPPHPGVAVETLQAVTEVDVDERGRFRLPAVESPFRLRVRTDDVRITTPWVIG